MSLKHENSSIKQNQKDEEDQIGNGISPHQTDILKQTNGFENTSRTAMHV
jgi:hypothetical protein